MNLDVRSVAGGKGMRMSRSVENAREMYDRFAFGNFCYADRRANYYPLLREFVAMAGPSSLFADIGCGAGFWMDFYMRRGISRDRITGVDLAPSNAERLKERGIRGVCGNVLGLKLPDDSFDFTACNGVIHHTPDPRKAFGELVRITRPGGYVYLSVYNRWHPYFYIVHRATFPLRWFYWNVTKKIAGIAYPLWWALVQPVSLIAYRRLLEERTCRTLFMDQVITPHAALFTKGAIRVYAASEGAEVVKSGYCLRGLMVEAIIRVGPKR